MTGGKPSQRKGRRGELDAVKEAEEFGLDARPHGQYEALDCTIEGDMYEVKTCETLSMRRVLDALHSGARGLIWKCNREHRTITVSYRDWLEDQRDLKELRASKKHDHFSCAVPDCPLCNPFRECRITIWSDSGIRWCNVHQCPASVCCDMTEGAPV